MHVFINFGVKSATLRNMGEPGFFLIHIGPTMHLNITRWCCCHGR